MSGAEKSFEFRRTTDPTTYRFHRDGQHNGRPKWKREDKDLWCLFDSTGWIVADSLGARLGWPLDQSTSSAENPPATIWHSQKGEKWYRYTLVYIDGSD
jgi:hypothetical protein